MAHLNCCRRTPADRRKATARWTTHDTNSGSSTSTATPEARKVAKPEVRCGSTGWPLAPTCKSRTRAIIVAAVHCEATTNTAPITYSRRVARQRRDGTSAVGEEQQGWEADDQSEIPKRVLEPQCGVRGPVEAVSEPVVEHHVGRREGEHVLKEPREDEQPSHRVGGLATRDHYADHSEHRCWDQDDPGIGCLVGHEGQREGCHAERRSGDAQHGGSRRRHQPSGSPAHRRLPSRAADR